MSWDPTVLHAEIAAEFTAGVHERIVEALDRRRWDRVAWQAERRGTGVPTGKRLPLAERFDELADRARRHFAERASIVPRVRAPRPRIDPGVRAEARRAYFRGYFQRPEVKAKRKAARPGKMTPEQRVEWLRERFALRAAARLRNVEELQRRIPPVGRPPELAARLARAFTGIAAYHAQRRGAKP
ncbi:MAG: hypothetical protein Q8S13_10600 [Dehalococcoidia bacterium]|nr:hypothetical protein [Dehalococcoidia bacterium]